MARRPAVNMAATASGANESTEFNFRMCKKVAELTMVVHLLFKQNHESELTSRLLQQHFEAEIARMQQEHELQVKNLEQLLSAEAAKGSDVMAEEKWRAQNETLQTRLAAVEASLAEEHKTVTRLREMITASEQQTHTLHDELSQAKSLLDGTALAKDTEIERLKNELLNASLQLDKLRRLESNQSSQLNAKQQELSQEVERLERLYQEESKLRAQLQLRNAQLVQELTQMRVTLASRTDLLRQSPQVTANYEEALSELESLRNELLRYKKELQNREENYNRVFTQFRPVRLDRISVNRLNNTTLNTGGKSIEKELSLSGLPSLAALPGLTATSSTDAALLGHKRASVPSNLSQHSQVDYDRGKVRSDELVSSTIAVANPSKIIGNFSMTNMQSLLKRRKSGPTLAIGASQQSK